MENCTLTSDYGMLPTDQLSLRFMFKPTLETAKKWKAYNSKQIIEEPQARQYIFDLCRLKYGSIRGPAEIQRIIHAYEISQHMLNNIEHFLNIYFILPQRMRTRTDRAFGIFTGMNLYTRTKEILIEIQNECAKQIELQQEYGEMRNELSRLIRVLGFYNQREETEN